MKINAETIIKTLDSIYNNALLGLPKTPSVTELAEEYREKENGDIEQAINDLVKWQTAKNTTNGFVCGIGGAFTLPITIPVELTAALYIQVRMVAAIAYLCGHDPSSDKVKTLVYCSLVGDQCKDILKKAGVEFGTRLTKTAIMSIGRDTIVAINQLVGFRLVTKFGEKGVINLGS